MTGPHAHQAAIKRASRAAGLLRVRLAEFAAAPVLACADVGQSRPEDRRMQTSIRRAEGEPAKRRADDFDKLDFRSQGTKPLARYGAAARAVLIFDVERCFS